MAYDLNTPEGLRDYCIDVSYVMMKKGQTREVVEKFVTDIYIEHKFDFTEFELKDLVLEEYCRVHTFEDPQPQLPTASKRSYQQELEDLIDFRGPGEISTLDIYTELKITTQPEKNAIRVALSRLTDSGRLVKSTTGKTGVYRIKSQEVLRTKFLPQSIPEFPIVLPVDLNLQCKLFAKNIIVVAGTKSAGKSAFLLKIAIENQARMPVVYLNSEMGDEEFTDRMKKFGVTSAEEIQFDCIECHAGFSDHITPERKIFIIDYLEIHDNFYAIAQPIRAIHEQLRDGIAIIAIQKKKNEQLGRGAEFSMEKARLYLNLEYREQDKCSRITIIDAKNPKRSGVNGAYRDIKIVNGASFRPKDTWKFPHGEDEKSGGVMGGGF